MSFSKDNNTDSKAPWVEIDRPISSRIDETDRLLNTSDNEATAVEAVPCMDNKNISIPGAVQSEVMEREEYHKAVVAASATAGGILGCLMGGIGCAILGGLGTAYAAKYKEGSCIGDCARAMGEVTLTAREKAIALDQKHHIVNYTQTAAAGALENAKAMDEEYHVAEKSKNCLVHTGKAAMDFAARHKLVERGVSGVGRGMSYLGGRVSGAGSGDPPTTLEGANYAPVNATIKAGI